MQNKQPQQRSYMRLHDILKLLPISKRSWYRGVRLGYYPQPRYIGPQAKAWKTSEILELIAEIEKTKDIREWTKRRWA